MTEAPDGPAPSPAPQVVVALGSNLGASADTVRSAFRRLEAIAGGPLTVSSLWHSTPVDCPPGSPAFINACAIFPARPDDTPESLLAQLLEVERVFGRTRKLVPNEARSLDLDLIAFGRETRQAGTLALPHPRAHLRRFVLAPLAEIAPDLILPGSHHTVAQLLESLDTLERVTRLRA